tara:strand:- start:758 stop:1444 length:687 start_codon:yes stop_codon:yes gene_type:complete
MALPKLNETPKYSLTVPSTGKECRYRPYLVKEEKILLMASSSEDPKQIMNAVHDTVGACVEGLDVRSLTTFDLEYIFIQLRSKSTGETSDILLKCPECESQQKVTIPLNEIKVSNSTADPVIKISDTVTVVMKYPSYQDIPTDAGEDVGFNLIASSIKSVISGDEKIEVEDEPFEGVIGFLESMTQDQFKLITQFFEDSPVVKYDLPFVCQSCGAAEDIEIKGMQSFF